MLVIALWISATIEKRILREAVTDLSMRKVASNAVRAFLLLIGLLFALSAVGVDLTALSVLGGALGVGLGFGLQKLAANYVSGFVILLERSIRIGDNVKVDGFEGRITDIKTRYTLIRAGNGRESIVPNESLITEPGREPVARRPQVQHHDQHRGRLRQRRGAGAGDPVRRGDGAGARADRPGAGRLPAQLRARRAGVQR